MIPSEQLKSSQMSFVRANNQDSFLWLGGGGVTSTLDIPTEDLRNWAVRGRKVLWFLFTWSIESTQSCRHDTKHRTLSHTGTENVASQC